MNKIVKLGKLAKTLRRDLAANPLKAGVLGVLLLGGLYFWGPLIWKYAKGAKPADSASFVVATSSSEQKVAAENSSVQPVVEIPREAWQEIRSHRADDPSAHSATYRSKWGQIFQSAATVAPPTQPQLEVTEARQLDEDPGKLGLTLQGVAVGISSKKAMINGKVYRELDVITIEKTANHPELKFLVVQVSRKMVEVEHGGRRWQLSLRPKATETSTTKDSEPTSQAKDPVQGEPTSSKKTPTKQVDK